MKKYQKYTGKVDHVKGIWITWETQRRNIGISRSFGIPLYQFDIRASRIVRYIKSIIATYRAINNENPKFVVAQNPSIILALFVVLYKRNGCYFPVIDAHNGGIYPFENKSRFLRSFSCWLQRNAALTIVTNKTLKDVVEKNGGAAFVLPDAIPSTPNSLKRKNLKGDINLTCICTFNEDEPYLEIIKAAKLLSTNTHVYFTGKFEGKIISKDLPENIHLTGFIPEKEYWDLLYSSDIIIDLTLRENCLVCGAYEGIALGKPLILSNTNALKEYFSKGCIYADPVEKDIFRAIQASIENMEDLQKNIKLLKMELEVSWLEKISQLKNKINRLDH